MCKKLCLKVVVILFWVYAIFVSPIFANEIQTNINQEENTHVDEKVAVYSNDNLTEEELQKQKDELLKMLKEIMNQMRIDIKRIDEKFVQIRQVEEYEKYPAIRLNIDTPIFGLDSIVDSKLKIKQDVSATDIANGYSIRYILKNNSLKLPDKYLAGIIVGTRDVKLDDKISLSDANAALIKLMQYTKMIDNTLEFLENQVNKFFKGYIEKEKEEKINDILKKLTKLEENLLEQDKKIMMLSMISFDEEQVQIYQSLREKYQEISKKTKENQENVNNMLIKEQTLIKIQKEVLELESNMIDFSAEVEDDLKLAKESIDVEKMLISLQTTVKNRYQKITKLEENSVTKKEILQEKQEESEGQNKTQSEQNKENVDGSSESKIETTEEIKNYDLTSKNILSSIEEDIIKVLDEKVKEFVKEEKKSAEDMENSNDPQVQEENGKKEEEKQLSKEEKFDLLEQMYTLYQSYLIKENKFYLDNINFTLKNTTAKVSDLSKYTKSDILSQMRYIYLELPNSLEQYSDTTNFNSMLEIRTMSNQLLKELNQLLQTYMQVTKIYQTLNVDEMKNNA